MRAIDTAGAYLPAIADTPSHRLHRINTAEYPWINSSEAEVAVPTARLPLGDGTEVYLGSLIKFNSKLVGIADAVPDPQSASAHGALMQALPAVLKGERHSSVAKIENSSPDGPLLFGASRNIAKLVRLIFAVERTQDAPATVLRVAISMPKKHDHVMSILGVRASRRSHR